MLRFEHVHYRSPKYDDDLLHDVHFELNKGSSLVLTGSAGNGKTTALTLALGLFTPQHGGITVLGKPVHLLSSVELEKFRSRIGYVAQQGGLLSNLSIVDNVALQLRYHRDPTETEVKHELDRVQDLLGISRLPTIPAALAPLYMRRLATLARALILSPELLIVDEPSRGLAGSAKHGIWNLIASIRQRLDLTVLAATSDAETAYVLGGEVLSLPSRRNEPAEQPSGMKSSP